MFPLLTHRCHLSKAVASEVTLELGEAQETAWCFIPTQEIPEYSSEKRALEWISVRKDKFGTLLNCFSASTAKLHLEGLK